MGLSGYRVDRDDNDWIMDKNSPGEAVAAFPGASGEYDLTLNAVAEDDGQSTLEVWVDNSLLATFLYPLGDSSRQPITFTIPTLTLTTGDQIKLVGYKDTTSLGTSHARLDDLVFQPSTAC